MIKKTIIQVDRESIIMLIKQLNKVNGKWDCKLSSKGLYMEQVSQIR